MFGLHKKNLVGLDIDTTAVHMVQLRREENGYVVGGACSTEIAPWGDDPELRRIHTIGAIRQGLSNRDIDGKLAVCGLRGPEVVVRSFEFPLLPPEEIGSAVGLEASQICPFSPDESTFDYQVTSMDAGKTQGFWVAANNGLIRSTRQLVHEAGLHCALLDVAGLALLNCLQASPSGSDDTQIDGTAPYGPAVVDIGGSCTTIAIMDHAGRPFIRDTNSGSDQILRRMADEARVPFEIVKAALLNCESARDCAGKADSKAAGPQSVSWDNLEAVCGPLVDDIATTLRYYAAQHGSGLPAQGTAPGAPGVKVERLLVCGVLAGVKEFIELLRAKLHIDVAVWNPVEVLRGDEAKARRPAGAGQETGSSMSLAAGLAMRSL